MILPRRGGYELEEKPNIQPVPFSRTNGGVCAGTIRHSLLWMDVSMPLIVAKLLLETIWLTVMEILLTLRGVMSAYSVFGLSRADYGAGDLSRCLFVLDQNKNEEVTMARLHTYLHPSAPPACAILWMESDGKSTETWLTSNANTMTERGNGQHILLMMSLCT